MAGPGILMTGHDLLDLHELLKQCEGTDVKVYTHGEMLPAHMYPGTSRPSQSGGPLWRRLAEAEDGVRRVSPGPTVATTNCVLIPQRIVCRSVVYDALHRGSRWDSHHGRRFLAVIAKAQACPPLPDSEIESPRPASITA